MEWFGDCRCVPSSKHISTDKQTFLGLWEPSQNLSNRRYCYSEGGKPELLGFFTKRRKNQIEDIGPKIFACIKWEGQHVGHKALEGFVLSTAFPSGFVF